MGGWEGGREGGNERGMGEGRKSERERDKEREISRERNLRKGAPQSELVKQQSAILDVVLSSSDDDFTPSQMM